MMSLNQVDLAAIEENKPHILEPELEEIVYERKNFFDLTLEQLKEILSKYGKEKFRAQQIFSWVYQKGITDFEQMTNLSKDLRAELPKILEFRKLELVSHLKSVDGTQKFLFKIGGDEKYSSLTFEAVIIPSKDRSTLCVSSEVGCNMACKFCFTGKQKLKRRLSAGDIVNQFIQVSDKLEGDQKITNIVFMGMGEPLDNPDAVFNSIKILNSPWGRNFSRKRVTVSTSGIVPNIKLIAESGARLAISLNATTDVMRDDIMPINKRYPLAELLEGCREYHKTTNDEITFEYVMLKDLNDTLEDAKRIKQLTKGIPCKINLIPFNEHPGSDYKRPERTKVLDFQEALMRMGMHVLIRRTMGRDIYAACGQLTSTYAGKPTRLTPDVMNQGVASV
jgi:23S rRNA (adenine2503-C2)-methyltransferase